MKNLLNVIRYQLNITEGKGKKMYKLYDTEKELFLSDYKPIDSVIKILDNTGLIELLDNILQAFDNAILYHSELLSMALYDNIVTIKKRILMSCISAYGSGTIASFIGKTKYKEIDKAVNKTLYYLYHAKEENIFMLSVDM